MTPAHHPPGAAQRPSQLCLDHRKIDGRCRSLPLMHKQRVPARLADPFLPSLASLLQSLAQVRAKDLDVERGQEASVVRHQWQIVAFGGGRDPQIRDALR